MNKRVSPGLARLSQAMPELLSALEDTITRIVDDGKHNLILVIGHDNVSQYVANIPRPEGVKILRDLFARWELNLDEVLPDEHEPDDTRAFQYLLDQHEKAVRSSHCDLKQYEVDYESTRSELLTFVGRLQLKAKR